MDKQPSKLWLPRAHRAFILCGAIVGIVLVAIIIAGTVILMGFKDEFASKCDESLSKNDETSYVTQVCKI